MTAPAASRSRVVLDAAYYAVAIFFFVYLFLYFWTSEGGPTLLAMTLVPITFVLFVLNLLRENDLYPRLPWSANCVIGAVYAAVAVYVSYYMHTEYYDLGTSRAGSWAPYDLFVGGLMTVLVMEYARKRHMPLFVLNIILILYAVYGYLMPGMFYHAGLSWWRVGTAMSVETTTGIFSNLPQIALTIVGAFLLVLAALSAFGCIELLLRATKRVAARSAHALPQSAVVGSMCVGTVSGSGAANAITIGSATIPAMIGAGMPRATAAAIEFGVLARRPIDAAGDGRCRVPDGRVSGQELFRGGRARLCAGPDLLRHGRGLRVSAGAAPPHPRGKRHLRKADLARLDQSRCLPQRDRRAGRS